MPFFITSVVKRVRFLSYMFFRFVCLCVVGGGLVVYTFCLYSLFIRFCLSVGEVWFLVAFLGDWQFYEESSAFSLLAFKGYYAFLCFH